MGGDPKGVRRLLPPDRSPGTARRRRFIHDVANVHIRAVRGSPSMASLKRGRTARTATRDSIPRAFRQDPLLSAGSSRVGSERLFSKAESVTWLSRCWRHRSACSMPRGGPITVTLVMRIGNKGHYPCAMRSASIIFMSDW